MKIGDPNSKSYRIQKDTLLKVHNRKKDNTLQKIFQVPEVFSFHCDKICKTVWKKLVITMTECHIFGMCKLDASVPVS